MGAVACSGAGAWGLAGEAHELRLQALLTRSDFGLGEVSRKAGCWVSC